MQVHRDEHGHELLVLPSDRGGFATTISWHTRRPDSLAVGRSGVSGTILNRDHVADLVRHLQAWLETGSLVVVESPEPPKGA
jgi:hypothetical protein